MTLVKGTKWLYTVYFYIFNFLLRVLKLFIRTDENLILINSFGGKKYDDSPKALYEAMVADKRFENYTFVWAFHQPELFQNRGLKTVKTDTFSYFVTALKAKCWISNSSIERGLDFKGKHTFYFNTWHGTPIKKMGKDISADNLSFRSKKDSAFDIMTVQSDFEADVFSRAFQIGKDKLLKCGLPRNDILEQYTEQKKVEIREKLDIPTNKKVILYAPTFREYERDAGRNCVLIPPMNLAIWQRELGCEYCLLFRPHYEVAKAMEIQENHFVKDMSAYPCLSDLMIVADILISDYSSIFFDFSIMDKPMLHFTYDYQEYSEKRGMYFDIREYLHGAEEERGVIRSIIQMVQNEEVELTRKFRNRYVNYYGNAVQQSLDCIAEYLK